MHTVNDDAFGPVYRENAKLVYRYLISVGCPTRDVEDILQETFVKALINIDSYRGESKISVWLCQIAKNVWFDQLKKWKRNATLPFMEEGIQDSYLCDWVDLIEQLVEPYRSVFMKKALGDCSYSSLAYEYGKSENWVRVTFYRARVQLQKMLNEKGDE